MKISDFDQSTIKINNITLTENDTIIKYPNTDHIVFIRELLYETIRTPLIDAIIEKIPNIPLSSIFYDTNIKKFPSVGKLLASDIFDKYRVTPKDKNIKFFQI